MAIRHSVGISRLVEAVVLQLSCVVIDLAFWLLMQALLIDVQVKISLCGEGQNQLRPKYRVFNCD